MGQMKHVLREQTATIGSVFASPHRTPLRNASQNSASTDCVAPLVQPFIPSSSPDRMDVDCNDKKQESVKAFNYEDVSVVDPPDKKVNVLEIDNDGNFESVEYMMSPAKKPGDYSVFAKVVKTPLKENNPSPCSKVKAVRSFKINHALKHSLKHARIQAREHKNAALSSENGVLGSENFNLRSENAVLHSKLAEWQGGSNEGSSRKRRRFN